MSSGRYEARKARIRSGGETVRIRRATVADVPAIVGLYAADEAFGAREDLDALDGYRVAFAAVDADPAHFLAVAEVAGGEVVGTLHLTVLPGIARRGLTRALVESVHVRPDRRGQGVGGELMRWVIAEARARGCGVVQLTSNKARPDAHRFYERLGFEASHVGFKLVLD